MDYYNFKLVIPLKIKTQTYYIILLSNVVIFVLIFTNTKIDNILFYVTRVDNEIEWLCAYLLDSIWEKLVNILGLNLLSYLNILIRDLAISYNDSIIMRLLFNNN